MTQHRYTVAEDARLRGIFAMKPLSPERVQALNQMAADLEVSTGALRSRNETLRIARGERHPDPKRQHRSRHLRDRKPVAAPVARAPMALPVIERPAWMTPLTRERLMAGR